MSIAALQAHKHVFCEKITFAGYTPAAEETLTIFFGVNHLQQ